MKRICKIFFLFFFTGILFVLCKKDKDTIPPGISIIKPLANSTFSVFETIEVAADISDDVQLVSVSVQLMKEDLTPALGIFKKGISGKSFSLKTDYAIDDQQLVSGFYYLKVGASDGLNETKEYSKIYINESSVNRKGILIISVPGINNVSVSMLDSFYNAVPFINTNCDYTSSCVSSENQYLNLLGSSLCGLTSYRISDSGVQWNEPSIGNLPYFMHLDFYNETSYVCYKSGYIRGFDKNGSVKFSSASNSGFYPVRSFLHNAGLFAEEVGISGNNQRKLTMYIGTGFFAKSVNIPIEVVAFAGKDDENIFLFGNENGQGKILVYKISENSLWSPISLATGNIIKDAVQINSNTYLVALQDGVYKYEFSPVNFLKLIPFSNTEELKYDEENNVVYASSGNNLGMFDYNSGAEVNSYIHPLPIRDFHLLYSR